MALYIIGMLLLTAAFFGLLVWAVKKLRKKSGRRAGRFTLLAAGAGLLSLLAAVAAGTDVTSMLLLLGCLTLPAAVVLLIVGAVRKRRGKPRRGCRIAAAVCFGFTLCALVGTGVAAAAGFPGKDAKLEALESSIRTEYDFEVVDGTEPVTVVTSTGCTPNPDYVIHGYRMVYDSCDLPYVLENCDAGPEDCLAALDANPEISEEYRCYFRDFVGRIAETYPEADLSILCENLKTLRVVELNQADYLLKSLSLDSYGCYMRTENTIYIPVGTEYVEGEWGFQVLLHEFCHAARTCWRETEEGKDRIQFCSETGNMLIEESMNSVFSCSLLHYEERDIAYQVPSNYLSIMLECVDNYRLSDYLNHSKQYFFRKLDEATGYTNYAQVLWKLITLQRSDWEDEDTDIPAEEYEPIYAYLCSLYYGKYLTPGMSPEAAEAVAAELADKAFFDAPEGYKTDPEYFTRHLSEYLR